MQEKSLKISFILPCYNVAPYIGRCIESIEHQDIPQMEYEVICVDDCSKDNTVDVIRTYQRQYANIQLICHEENRTAGGARNTGLEAAKAEYIWFVDPDDKVINNVLKKLYCQAESQDVDILAFNIRDTYENGTCVEQTMFVESKEVMNGQEFFLQPHLKGLHSAESVYASLYKREFLQRKALHFPEIKASQDVVFTWECVLVAERCASIADVCYDYIHRPNSTTGSNGRYSAKTILSHALLFTIELQRIMDANPHINEQFFSQLCDTQNYALNCTSKRIIQSSCKERKLFYQSLRPYAAEIQQFQPKMNRKTKIIFRYNRPFIIWESYMISYRIRRFFRN